MADDRHGAKQPRRFDPARAAILDDTARFTYVPPETLLAGLAPAPGSTLVDYGAGTGLYAVEIARRRPDVRVIALEEQPEMLARLRETIVRSGVANIEAIDPSGLEMLTGRVDRILALNVLHELGDAALRQLRTLLTEEGRALIVDWDAAVDRPFGPPRDHVYDVEEASRRLADAGFAIAGQSSFAYHYALLVRPSTSSG